MTTWTMPTRAEVLAYNAGIGSAMNAAAALAEDIGARLADDPQCFAAAIAALEALLETLPGRMLPAPIICDEPCPCRGAQNIGGPRNDIE